jgi:MFS family permease
MASQPERRGLFGLLGAVGVSLLGTRMSFLALPWFVLSTTGSATQTGLVAAAELTPYVLVQALGGPVIDRVGAWRTSVVTDLGAAVFVGAIPLLHILGALSLDDLVVIVAVAGALRGAGDAARDVLVPGVGERAKTPLERSAGLYDGVNRCASLIGAPAAGMLVEVTSALNVLALDAAAFGASAVLVGLFVPRDAQPDAPEHPAGNPSYFASLHEGFGYLRSAF